MRIRHNGDHAKGRTINWRVTIAAWYQYSILMSSHPKQPLTATPRKPFFDVESMSALNFRQAPPEALLI